MRIAIYLAVLSICCLLAALFRMPLPAQPPRIIQPKEYERTKLDTPGWWRIGQVGDNRIDYYVRPGNLLGAIVYPSQANPDTHTPSLVLQVQGSPSHRLDMASEEEAHKMAMWIIQEYENERKRTQPHGSR